MSGRRSKDDEQWVLVKNKVFTRDNYQCQLCRVLTAQEMGVLKRTAHHFELGTTDPAHIFGVGPFPSLIYVLENIVTLNRFSHDMLDTCRSPINGDRITRNEREQWWIRIVGEERYQYLSQLIKN